MVAQVRRTNLGATLDTSPETGVHFRVWAPNAKKVHVVIASSPPAGGAREVALAAEPGGYAAGFVAGVEAGARYQLRLDDKEPIADPASRFQPEGPFGPSQVVDPRGFRWTDDGWTGLDPHEHVVYELHVGTFTRAGTFATARDELPFLAELGITTIELMPLAGWAGTTNWGYDGVNMFAPHHAYGPPDELRAFVDRAHALGLAVILDVVWNHLGPAGNVLPAFSADYFHHDKANDWGDGINFEHPEVRAYFIANALYWIDEFHLDGFRVDATQAIHDTSPTHILAEIITKVRAATPGRRLWIAGENEPQDAKLLRAYGFDALWNDDFHHTARVAATGVVDGYLHDYTGSARELVAAIRHGFLYQGQAYAWQRNTRGTPTRGLARAQFVHFLENHDQVANLAFGERLAELADPATLRALTALVLLTPSIPLLFQGQETGSTRPWEFFCSHDGELADGVRRGRAQFVSQFQRLATREAQAARRDPCAPATFEACILDPAERDFSRPLPALHRDLLRLRRGAPAFTRGEVDAAVLSESALVVRCFGAGPADDRLLLVNLGPTFHHAVVPEPLLAPPEGAGWTLAWSSEDPRYGGHGTPPPITLERVAIPGHAALLLIPEVAAQLHLDPSPPSGDKVPVDP